jgi:hypothetical protein
VSSIIVTSIPVHGHITPMLAVAENFVTRGSVLASHGRASGGASEPSDRHHVR